MDLPAPDSPTTPNISPVFKLKETSSKAIRVPFLVGIFYFEVPNL